MATAVVSSTTSPETTEAIDDVERQNIEEEESEKDVAVKKREERMTRLKELHIRRVSLNRLMSYFPECQLPKYQCFGSWHFGN